MKPRDVRGVLALLPLLAAFGPCALPDEQLGTRSALADEEGPRHIREDTDVIVVPRGIAVILQCRGTCGSRVFAHSRDPSRVFAGATRSEEPELGEVVIVVGLVEGETKIAFDIFDNSYELRVRVTATSGSDASDAPKVFTIGD